MLISVWFKTVICLKKNVFSFHQGVAFNILISRLNVRDMEGLFF